MNAGSALATTLYRAGWSPDQPFFEFICKRGFPGTVLELYTFGEKTSLQHEYTILRIEMHGKTSWLRVDWTGVLNQWDTKYSPQDNGSVIWTISLDIHTLVLPTDRLFRRVDASLPFTNVCGMIAELSRTPYHLVFWNCMEFAQELHRRIDEATSSKESKY